MIKEFKNNEIRPSGIINRGMFEQVKMLYKDNPEVGGELAVSLMEFVLTGDFSSDNFMVAFAMANHKEVVVKNQERYDAKKEAKMEAIESSLREIAELYKSGMKQVDIARQLGMQPPNVSKKLSKIRKEFPWLLEISGNVGNSEETLERKEIPEISGKMETLETFVESSDENGNVSKISSFQNFQHDNVNVNVNDNVNLAGNPSGVPGRGSAPTPPTDSHRVPWNF